MKTETRSNSSLDCTRLTARPADREFFDRHLSSFVPREVFDVHAHLSFDHDERLGFREYTQLTEGWMGDHVPRRGLFFSPPSTPDVDAANVFIATECEQHDGCDGLLLVRPQDNPAEIETKLNEGRFVGFKVYYTFADRRDPLNAQIDEYVPRWMWEIADRRSLIITLHLVRDRALADPSNQQLLKSNLKDFPGCKLVLAHAGRGFCAQHTIDGVAGFADADNVFFDTSAICEPAAFLAVLHQFGPSRLMYGSDFPVSNIRGRAVSIGDSFVWLDEGNFDWSLPKFGQPTLVGIESLLALKQAAMFAKLGDTQLMNIFRNNALKLLGKR